MKPAQFDVIMIGGGAAGLLAAGAASELGKRVLLLEKNRKWGVKILMSGGTRCNITHQCDARGIVAAFGKKGNFLHSPLAAFSPSDVVQLMHAYGVETKTESTGKIFPVSNRAIDVRDALVQFAEGSGATLANLQAVQSIQYTEGQYQVSTERDQFSATSIVITTGGRSYPGCGTTGDGYAWAQQFGHSIVPTVPALVPILSRCQWANELKGITVPKSSVSILDPDADTKSKVLSHRAGSFLFTHWGFSGPSVLDVSREVAQHPEKNRLSLVGDFLPDIKLAKLEADLMHKKQEGGKQAVGNLLNEYFPKRFGESLLAAAGIPTTLKNAELSKTRLAQIVRQVKQCEFAINGTLGFEKAEVTAGGVALDEVNSKTMESKLQPNLYFAGEILDLDGYIGGFNFQSAFSTGFVAGVNA